MHQKPNFDIYILEDDLPMLGRLVSVVEEWEKKNSIVVGTTNQEFRSSVVEKTPDILLADINLPDGKSYTSIDIFSKLNPQGIILVISTLNDSATILRSILCGAIGYMHKDDSNLSIINSLNESIAGNSPISPSIARMLISHLNNNEEIL